jgi:hypothetical protein
MLKKILYDTFCTSSPGEAAVYLIKTRMKERALAERKRRKFVKKKNPKGKNVPVVFSNRRPAVRTQLPPSIHDKVFGRSTVKRPLSL